METPTYSIEHRAPKKGETYIITGGGQPPSIMTAHDDWRDAEADVLVPVAPPWPEPPVIVIEESPDVDLDLLPVVAIRDHNGDYIYAGHLIAQVLREGRDSITAWHEYVPDGYVPQEKVYEAAAQGAAAAAPEPRREYTADELDDLPEGACAWDECGSVWQRGFPSWYVAGGSRGFTNPLRERFLQHLYSAPKH